MTENEPAPGDAGSTAAAPDPTAPSPAEVSVAGGEPDQPGERGEPGEHDPFEGPDWDANARRRVRTSTEQVRRRVHGKSRRKRRIFWGLSAFGFLVLVAVGWLAYTAYQARSQLQQVQAQVHTLRTEIGAGDFAGARATASSLQNHAAQAHDLTTGPIWSAAAAIPYLGDPLDTVRVVSVNVDRIATAALPPLVDASSSLDPQHLRRPDGSFALDAIQKVVPVLGNAISIMQHSVAQVSATSSSTWLGPVNTARGDLLSQLPSLVSTLRSADLAARTVPTLLGADGPKDYLVSFENEAELRGLGGLPGAFAIMRADQGKISFVQFESDSVLTSSHVGEQSPVDLGPDYRQVYHGQYPASEWFYVDSDVSPHFPYAAQVWASDWQLKSGQKVDGAIALDPTALSYLLRVTGPTQLADGTKISAGNIVRLTQQTAYTRYGGNSQKQVNQRKEFLLDIARAVSHHLIDSKANATALVKAAVKAADQHRLQLWTTDAQVEAELASTPMSGQVPVTSAPYAGIALNNNGGTKLDYYLHASMDLVRSGCGATRDVTVTIKLQNDAPARLPPYVYGETGLKGLPQQEGVNRTFALYYATKGSTFTSVTVNGATTGATSGTERGHPAFGVLVDTPAGRTTTIVLHLTEPGSTATPITRVQPMVNPMQLTVRNGACAP